MPPIDPTPIDPTPIASALFAELASASNVMIAAASAAETEATVETLPDGKRRFRPLDEATRLAIVWQAMLRAALFRPAA